MFCLKRFPTWYISIFICFCISVHVHTLSPQTSMYHTSSFNMVFFWKILMAIKDKLLHIILEVNKLLIHPTFEMFYIIFLCYNAHNIFVIDRSSIRSSINI